jgi:hypothetical protein
MRCKVRSNGFKGACCLTLEDCAEELDAIIPAGVMLGHPPEYSGRSLRTALLELAE